MNPRERIMTAFLLEEPDIVPISAPLGLFVPKEFWDTIIKGSDPTYWIQGDVPYSSFLNASDKLKTRTTKITHDDLAIHESVIETPKGLLNSRYEVTKSGGNRCIKGYIEEEDDVEKFLSLPYEPCRPDLKPFFDLVERFGDKGLVMFCLEDAVNIVANLFALKDFYVWIYKKPHLIKALFDAVHPRIMDFAEFLLKRGVGPMFNINGPEYVCPTFVNPRIFDSLVAAYDRDLIKLVHEYSHLMMIHCHGRVNDLLERFVNMGVDALNPLEERLETWSSGDIDLADAKERVGHRMCLVGSVPTGDLEMGNKELIERRTREAIEKAAEGGGFILIYSGAPRVETYFKTRFVKNVLNMVKFGRKYGKYPHR